MPEHRGKYVTLGLISCEVRGARAEAALAMQRETTAVIRLGELLHVDVDTSLVRVGQFSDHAPRLAVIQRLG